MLPCAAKTLTLLVLVVIVVGGAQVPGKIDIVLCTGNLCTKEMQEFLHSIANTREVHGVRGDFDDAALAWPETKVVQVEKFRIGLCHGHTVVPWGDPDALAALQRKLDCDILVTGHTHQYGVTERDGKFFVNPGSATGAFSPCTPDVLPSFVLMDIHGSHLNCYLYRIINNVTRVDKSEFVLPA